eukprot:14705884-Heterocapsa_arctica.AAC.1
MVIDADGANSYVAKDIKAGDYEYIIFFPGRTRTGDKEEKTEYYKEHVKMHVDDNMFLDFYAS